ncbi:ABC transporter permease subunit [Luteolibacter soli]|uniref:ABC transporter permease subunit n=1 Tax=Luteolibacter soli TaxID=3135280 RepID=A0ABU9AV57_9BACT
MTFPRKIGLLLLLVAIAAALAFSQKLSLPSLRWFFSFAATPDEIFAAPEKGYLVDYKSIQWVPMDWKWVRTHQAEIVGYSICGAAVLLSLVLLIFGGKFHWNPLTLRRFTRFRSIGRGWLSFRLLMLLLLVALLDQALVGKRALAVKYEGAWHFPAFETKLYSEQDFGGEGSQEANYRDLGKRFKAADKGDSVIMPLVPWDPVLDTDELEKRELVTREGLLYRAHDSEPFNGYAVQYSKDSDDTKLRDARFRRGLREGPATLFDAKGEFVGKQSWHEGKLVETSVEDSATPSTELPWIEIIYKPAPPSLKSRHYLGTDSRGWDIAAGLLGGLQVIFKAAFCYILMIYGIGITIGSLMGYFGGVFDLVMDRVVEIVSNVPFLLVVMIVISNIGRDNIDLTTILLILCAFSWIGVSVYLRSATYREKARDYVAAARVQGAGTMRVIFRHILPNAISTLVTLLPFSVAGLATSLTALDFLGFGLPDRYPSWGRILEQGTSNLNSPWIVSSVFTFMVVVLLLITFVGEAIREAFDPKKFTTYQ